MKQNASNTSIPIKSSTGKSNVTNATRQYHLTENDCAFDATHKPAEPNTAFERELSFLEAN
jgi:hypothetical protein